jgi:hypothetical protein
MPNPAVMQALTPRPEDEVPHMKIMRISGRDRVQARWNCRPSHPIEALRARWVASAAPHVEIRLCLSRSDD